MLVTCDDYKKHYSAIYSNTYEGPLEEEDILAHGDSCSSCNIWAFESDVRALGVDPADYPCPHTAYYSQHRCDIHDDAWDCPDTMLVRCEDKSFGLPVRDGGTSLIAISHCPWCGIKL